MTALPTRKIASTEAILDGLADAVHGITSPFVCSGARVLDGPVALRFRDGVEIAVTPSVRPYEQEIANQKLVERCAPARFGKGRKTRYDRSVRDAAQLDAAGGAFSVLRFDPAASGILDEVRRRLAPADPNPISAELYALNIYGSGGHFRPHKDTPRGDDMLGTLVVCLPSRFYGGQLVVHHRGAFKVFDWGQEIGTKPEPNRVHWAAFFGDVDHAVERVWGGSRVTLSYLLRRGQGAALEEAGEPSQNERFAQALTGALSDPKFMPSGGALAFPCFHMYSHDERFQVRLRPLTRKTVLALKGRDLLVAKTALDRGLAVTLHPYLIETCADQTWVMQRFPTEDERRGLGPRMDYLDIGDVLPVSGEAMDAEDSRATWVIRPPAFNSPPFFYGSDADGKRLPLDPDLPALEYLHACEYSATGYFGNEASDTEFYVYAALHAAIPPFGEGPRASAPPPKTLPRPAAKKPSSPALKRSKRPA